MYNLTKPQKLIYDMEKYAGGSIANVCGSIVIKGEKDISVLTNAVNELYHLNDALRIKINEKDGIPYQTVSEYKEQKINVLRFENKAELDSYAEKYAKEPMDFYGSLCEINVVVLKNSYGILVKLHHIISDAWTLSLVGSQFNTLANGEIPETYSYIDYIPAEQEYFNGKRYPKDKEYYIEQYKKCDDITYISDKQVKTFVSNRKHFLIDEEKTAKIQNYANEHKTSVYMLLMTALGTYINRIKTNQEKFYIGTAILNRTNAQEKNTMGMFINTAPVLIELYNQKTFSENLRTISKTLFGIIKHQKFNYGEVLETLRHEFDFSGNLYDVMLSYQNAKFTGIDTDFESVWYCNGMQTESLQMHIDDRDSEGILKIHYDYQVEKFNEKEIDRMHEHIFNLLFDAINEDKKITELAILSDKEKTTLLYDFNDTKADYPKDKCVHQLFEEQVLKTPDKTAVIACDKTLTYDELNKLSNKIANSLIEKGVQANDIVAFALPRNSYLIAVMFGILKSGAAYMPIDPDYPQDRIDYMLSDSDAKFFITEDNLNEFISNNEENPNIEMTSNTYCYCIYTSGTTGKPKGTIIRHRNLINFCNNNINNYQSCMINYGTRLVSTFKCCFDAFGVDYALFLLNGLSLVLANDYEMTNAEDLARLIKKHDADVIHSTPSTIKAFCGNKKYVEAIEKAKIIMVAAENFTPDLYDFLSAHTSAKVFNGYGPSETTIGVSFGEINSTDITIGKPIANTQIYILDKYNTPIPIGQIGELCIAGDGVGAGYLNRPEQTAEKFVDNPFGDGKMYKTGDLAYWREDGNIAYVGRNDFQVKIRGLRIELGEIESAIDSVKGVSQTVVVVRKDNNGRQLICAFYTEHNTVDIADIKSAISSKLPKYMMPHIFTVLSEMPLTSSGKINRKALPDVDLTNISNDTEYVAPTTEKEIVLTSEISSVLHLEKVGTADNFFDLGGDSLKAIELISKLESKGYKTTIKTVFDCETVKDLAEKLEQAETETAPFEWVGDIPATDAQMRVYTAQSMQENSTLYNVPYCFKTENIDFDRLQNAVNKLIARHEALRTHFENKDGHIIQVINDTATVEVEKLSGDNILDFIRPFDLEKAPLIRVGFYENTVMVDIHHIITDGSSMPVFFNELNELYMGRPLEDKVVQYKGFAVQTQDHTESEKYWLSVFDDEVPVLEINTDFPRGNKQTHNGSALYDTIDIEFHNKIKVKCKELNITPYAFYMSGFNVLLSKFSSNEDIVVGMPISGRDSKFLNTMGMFVNTIALHNKPVGTKSVSEFLTEVKENSINAIANQDYPFGELTKKLNIETSNRNPLFDVMFAFQSEEMTDVVFDDKKAELLSIPITTSKYDLTLNVMPRGNDVVLMVEYCTDLYKESTIKRMIEGYKQILLQMLDEASLIMDLSAITKNELQKLLHSFNGAKKEYEKDKCIHQIFEDKVSEFPTKVALKFDGKEFTYQELNSMANNIANELRKISVGKNDIVALVSKRSYHLVVAILGILKAGGAYLPIDYNYPKDRIDYIIDDAKCKAIVSFDVDMERPYVLCLEKEIPSTKENPQCINFANDLCAVIYTSGSTGTPKGTLLHHKGLVNYTYANDALYEGGDCNIGFATYTFDAFFLDIISPMLRGNLAVMATEDEQFNSKSFGTLIKSNPNCNFFITPAKLKQFIDSSEDISFLNNINKICIGGEVFPEELLELFSGKTKVFNVYGPTECSMWSVGGEIKQEENLDGKV